MSIDIIARNVVHKKLQENHQWAHVLSNVVENLNAGFYDHETVNAIFQKQHNYTQGFDLYDAYFFAQIWAEIELGDIILSRIDIGYEPYADAEIVAQNKILSSLDGITAEFWGNNQDEDGYVIFNGKTYPLEVGLCSVFKTANYIFNSHGCLARWAYGHKVIFLFDGDAVRIKASSNIVVPYRGRLV